MNKEFNLREKNFVVNTCIATVVAVLGEVFSPGSAAESFLTAFFLTSFLDVSRYIYERRGN